MRQSSLLTSKQSMSSMNAVDSFFKLLDHYVPDEKSLPLRALRATQNECSETKACGLMMFVQSHVSWWIDLAI